MIRQINDMVEWYKKTTRYYCTCCGGHIKNPTPRQMVDWCRQTFQVDSALASIAFRRFRDDAADKQ